jgi:uncharacterized damage-inducible protein DinB
MTFRTLLAASLLLTVRGLAQSGAADPVSGIWTGYLGRSEDNRTVVTIDIRYDGKNMAGTITGPQLTPGDIRSGAFDPATGSLRFEAVLRGEGTSVRFEGSLTQGTAKGRLFIGDQTGVFSITRGAAKPAAPAPPAPVDSARDAAQRGFTEVSGWVTRAAELVPADRYAYRPAPTVRTVAQLIGHIADAYNYYCGRAAARNVQWTDAIEKGSADKASLAVKLRQAMDACAATYAAGGAIAPLMENIAHTSLHYGNIITYMRLLGLTPPSS